MDISLRATLERIEEGWLVFLLEGGGHIELPATSFAHMPTEGMTFHFRMGLLPFENIDRAKLAKALLHHVLKPGNS